MTVCWSLDLIGVFEQYTAAKLGVEVQIIMPPAQIESIQAAFERNEVDIVRRNLTEIDVESAKASVEADEIKVKEVIQEDSSFDTVDTAVKDSMSDWCGAAFSAFLKKVTTI